MDRLDVAALSLRPELPAPERDVRAAARDFEALLLHQFVRGASKPLAGDSPLDGGPGGRMYRDLFLQEVARLAAQSDPLGLAKAVGADGPRAKPEGS